MANKNPLAGKDMRPVFNLTSLRLQQDALRSYQKSSRGMRGGTALLAGNRKYEKVKDLSSGAFGFVQLAKNKINGQLVAIKFLERGPDKITKHVSREIICHSNFCHPHVVQFKEVFLTPEHLAIAMEYVPGGDMFQHVKRNKGLPEPEARWFFQQLIVGLDYCHKMGVANRDIKLENTLLDGSPKPLVKITDFGYCKSDQESLPKSKVGTPGYTAPEIISARGHYDGKTADIWSCGVMLYVMLYCEYPFERPEDEADKYGFQKVLDRILKVDYRLPRQPRISEECKDLIRRILVADPAMRLTIPQIQDHPWYRKGLPANVIKMNAECLRLRPHDHPGYQTIEAIKVLVKEAGGRLDPEIDEFDDEDVQMDNVIDNAMDHESSGHA